MSISAPAPLGSAGNKQGGPFASVDALVEGLGGVGYIASRRIATALYMAEQLQKPILVEGVGRRRQDRAGALDRRALGRR